MMTTKHCLSDRELNSSPKRPRRTYGDWELNRLETVFAMNSYPDREHRNILAREMGVSSKNIQIWFQNRRARARTLHRKAEGIVENPIERMRLHWTSSSMIGSTLSTRCPIKTFEQNNVRLQMYPNTMTPLAEISNINNTIENPASAPSLGSISNICPPTSPTSGTDVGHHRLSVSNLSDISNSSFSDTLNANGNGNDDDNGDLFAETFLTLFSPGIQSAKINFEF